MQDLTQRLQALSSAEDFLQFFGVPHEAAVVRVKRLHILKRFNQYLHRAEGLDGLDEVETFRCYRDLLAQAYQDFVDSDAQREKVFKVFHQADGRQQVPFESLRAQLAERRRAA